LKENLPSTGQAQDIKAVGQQGIERGKQIVQEHSDNLAEQARRVLKDGLRDPALRDAMREIVDIMSSFGNPISDPINQNISYDALPRTAKKHGELALDAYDRVVDQLCGTGFMVNFHAKLARLRGIQGDSTLRAYFTEMSRLFNAVLSDPTLLDNSAFMQRFNQFFAQTPQWLQNSETNQLLRSLWSDFNTIVDAAWNDPYLNALWCSVTSLTSDFIKTNMDGTKSINKEAFSQLYILLAPVFARKLQFLPLPPMSYMDENHSVKLQNMAIKTKELPPDTVKLSMHSDMEFDINALTATMPYGEFIATLNDIDVEMPQVYFRYTKSNFPAMKDEGHLDFVLRNTQIKLIWKHQVTNYPYFTDARAEVSIGTLDYTISDDANHKGLYNFFGTFYKPKLESQMQEGLQNGLKQFADYVTYWLNRASLMLRQYTRDAANAISDGASYASTQAQTAGGYLSTAYEAVKDKAKDAAASASASTSSVTGSSVTGSSVTGQGYTSGVGQPPLMQDVSRQGQYSSGQSSGTGLVQKAKDAVSNLAQGSGSSGSGQYTSGQSSGSGFVQQAKDTVSNLAQGSGSSGSGQYSSGQQSSGSGLLQQAKDKIGNVLGSGSSGQGQGTQISGQLQGQIGVGQKQGLNQGQQGYTQGQQGYNQGQQGYTQGQQGYNQSGSQQQQPILMSGSTPSYQQQQVQQTPSQKQGQFVGQQGQQGYTQQQQGYTQSQQQTQRSQ